MDELHQLKDYLRRLGIGDDTASVYLELSKIGPTSALKLSRAVNLSRSQVYRELESLKEIALVSADTLRYGTLFRALPLENVEGILENRHARTQELSGELSAMVQAMQLLVGSRATKATIRHYYGIAGLRQANWNLTKAKKEFRVFETKHISEHFDVAFARRCRERILERKLHSYDLTNQKAQKKSELDPIDLARAKIRYIEPKVLDIKFEMYVYDDVVTLLDYSEDQRMAIEIHHSKLSAMMRQLFDGFWKNATEIEVS